MNTIHQLHDDHSTRKPPIQPLVIYLSSTLNVKTKDINRRETINWRYHISWRRYDHCHIQRNNTPQYDEKEEIKLFSVQKKHRHS